MVVKPKDIDEGLAALSGDKRAALERLHPPRLFGALVAEPSQAIR